MTVIESSRDDYLTFDETIEPWDQQPDETHKSYQAFQIFLELGLRRKLKDVARIWSNKEMDREEALRQQLTRGQVANIERWSRYNRWMARAEAWDRHLAAARRDAMLEEQRTMVKRHADIAVMMQGIALDKMRITDGEDLSVREALQMIRDAVDIERTARGVPTTVAHISTSGSGESTSVVSVLDVLFGEIAEDDTEEIKDGS